MRVTSVNKKGFKLKRKRSLVKPIAVSNPPGSRLNTYFKKMPPEVYQVWVDDMAAHARGGLTTSGAWERRDAAIKKYPYWFKWETKYNKIPQHVHDDYAYEVDPKFGKFWDVFEKDEFELQGVIPSAGLIEHINDPKYNRTYSLSGFTMDDFNKMVKSLQDESDRQWEIKQAELREQERQKVIWNKHYGPYKLEYREQ